MCKAGTDSNEQRLPACVKDRARLALPRMRSVRLHLQVVESWWRGGGEEGRREGGEEGGGGKVMGMDGEKVVEGWGGGGGEVVRRW